MGFAHHCTPTESLSLDKSATWARGSSDLARPLIFTSSVYKNAEFTGLGERLSKKKLNNEAYFQARFESTRITDAGSGAFTTV